MSAVPHLTERRVAPRPVFCVDASAHRDLAVAEAARAGRPRTGAPAGRCPTFAHGLDLAHAYRVTGDERFLAAWQRDVAAYPVAPAPGDGVADAPHVVARRMENWVYAWAGFAAADGLRGPGDDLAAAVLERIEAHAAHVDEHLSADGTERTVALYALLIVALAVPQLDPDGARRDAAIGELYDNLLTDVGIDGTHRERSAHRHCVALRAFVGARENARRFGLTLPAGYDEHLARACDFALHCHRPDGMMTALGGGPAAGHLDVLALAADLLDRDDLRWVATRGRDGAPPNRRCVSFLAGGYHVQRSGWGDGDRSLEDERFLLFDCGPLGPGGAADTLALEIATGDGVVVGSSPAPGLDGPAREACTEVLSRHSAPGLDVVHGQAAATGSDATHARRVAFVADEYWVIEDRIDRRSADGRAVRYRFAAEADGRIAIERRPGASVLRAPGVALVIAGDVCVDLEPRAASAPEGGEAAPVVSVAAVGAGPAAVTTVVMPLADGDAVPDVRVRRDGAVTTVEVARDAVADRVQWTDARAELDLGPLRCRACAGWLRTDADGPSRARAAGVCGAPIWTGWDRDGGMSAGREGDL